MAKKWYNVTCTLTYTGSVEVRAESLKEAVEKADAYFDGECPKDTDRFALDDKEVDVDIEKE